MKTLKQRIELLEKKVFGEPEKYQPVICNGLMWSKIAGEEMTWHEAMKYAKNLREGGYKDWRLPTVRELQNVYDYEKGKTKIKFNSNFAYFWSSTEYCNSQSNAWHVGLNVGDTDSNTKATSLAVRCVRYEK